MYSGSTVIYGVEVSAHMVSDALDLILNDNEIDARLDDDHHEFIDILNSQLKSKGYSCTCYCMHCCAFDESGFLYVGIELGEIVTAYRTDVDNYSSYDDFHQHMTSMLEETKTTYEANADKIRADLSKLFPHETVKIYTFANDCDRCT